MMGWLLGNLAILSVVGITALSWWLYGAIMWALGLPPDAHPGLNVLGAGLSLAAGYAYATALIRWIRRLEYRRARGL